jgi:hypothetical protein
MIYDKHTGEILRGVSCTEEDIKNQLGDNELFLEGSVNDVEYKVVDGKFVPYARAEKDMKTFELVKNTKPTNIRKDMTDEEVDQAISEYFMGMVDVSIWKVENYGYLRQCFYPPREDYLDAQVKLNSKDPADVSKGTSQLQNYYDQCLSVKVRFQKPITGIKEEI